jgi:DNA-binding transcriptional LysR family regulator
MQQQRNNNATTTQRQRSDMNDIKGALAFIAAANELSFTKAARHLDVSPQALAASIARMEQKLDTRLFNRTTRSIALTDEGRALATRLAPSLAAFQEAMQSVRDSGAAPSGVLRVSTASAFGRRYLMPLVPGFRTRYPAIELDLSFDDHKVDLVRDGFDVAIRGGNVADSSLVARRIASLEAVCVASPAYLKRNGIPKSPDDLAKHDLIALRFASGQIATWDFKSRGAAQSQSFTPTRRVLTLSDTAAIGEAAVGGVGIARVSLHFAFQHLKAGRLKIVLLGHNDAGRRELVMHYPHRTHIATRITAFADFMLEALKRDDSLRAATKNCAEFAAG